MVNFYDKTIRAIFAQQKSLGCKAANPLAATPIRATGGPHTERARGRVEHVLKFHLSSRS
jgi:hypothetical protein